VSRSPGVGGGDAGHLPERAERDTGALCLLQYPYGPDRLRQLPAGSIDALTQGIPQDIHEWLQAHLVDAHGKMAGMSEKQRTRDQERARAALQREIAAGSGVGKVAEAAFKLREQQAGNPAEESGDTLDGPVEQ